MLAVVLLIALLVFGLTTQAEDTSTDQALADGQAIAAPSFELEVLETGALPAKLRQPVAARVTDGQLALSELEGVPVVLNFWASWCGPCRDEAPVLERGWQKWGERGVLYLGLNMQDTTDDAIEFINEFGLRYPSIRDPDKEVASAYGLTGIPETYFIDAKGRVVAHAIGAVDQATLDRNSQAALEGELVSVVDDSGQSRPPR